MYYIPPKTEGPQQLISKGKLPDKYRNWLYDNAKLGLIPRKSKKKSYTDEAYLPDEIESKKILQFFFKPIKLSIP